MFTYIPPLDFNKKNFVFNIIKLISLVVGYLVDKQYNYPVNQSIGDATQKYNLTLK